MAEPLRPEPCLSSKAAAAALSTLDGRRVTVTPLTVASPGFAVFLLGLALGRNELAGLEPLTSLPLALAQAVKALP